MGKGPSQSDYQPTEAEKMNAAVAQAEYNRFKELYDPLLQQMRDESLTNNYSEIARGKGNADTMQALTANTNYRNTQQAGYQGDLAAALGGQLGQADIQAKSAQNNTQLSVLGTARGQVADAQKGMSQLARIKSSEAIERAKANQQAATAKFNAGAQLAGAYVLQGLENKATRGPNGEEGTWHTPVNAEGKRISSIKDRYLDYFGT